MVNNKLVRNVNQTNTNTSQYTMSGLLNDFGDGKISSYPSEEHLQFGNSYARGFAKGGDGSSDVTSIDLGVNQTLSAGRRHRRWDHANESDISIGKSLI